MTVAVGGKALEVRWSPRAGRALAARTQPLIVELELAFACFARKELRFHEVADECAPKEGLVPVNDKLALRVSSVIAQSCGAGRPGREAPAASFVPHWVRIDHSGGHWIGDYGW
ncbi:MAG: hypothetical protein M0037_04755 [Betaproteobacteria bacterium]|nr:hypothetical protein [Betaproteobacteria bacterium]